ncbi:MAG: hypothetical protein ACLFTN_11585, partial [Phycisphaerae bacterium]
TTVVMILLMAFPFLVIGILTSQLSIPAPGADHPHARNVSNLSVDEQLIGPAGHFEHGGELTIHL